MSLLGAEIEKINKTNPQPQQQQQQPAPDPTPDNSQNPDPSKPAPQEPLKIDDAALLAGMSASLGVKFESIDEAKAFMAKQQQPQPQSQQPAQPTEEQKLAAAQKRSLDIMQAFYANGGTEEEYKNIQRILATDGGELTKKEILAELEAEGFSPEDAVSIYKNRYFIADEADENNPYTEEQIKFGQKRLSALEQRLKNKAAEPLQKAADLIDKNNKIVEEWQGWENSVDEHFKSFTGETELSITDKDGAEIKKLSVKLSPEEISAIKGQMKDAKLVSETFYNTDNAQGAKNISDLLMWAHLGKTLASKAYDAGATDTMDAVEKTFPSRPLVRQITGDVVKNKEAKEKSQESYTAAALDAFQPKQYRGKTGS